MVFGMICVIVGIGVWLLNIFGGGFNWGRDWPFLLLVFGIYKIWDFSRKRRTRIGRTDKKGVKGILKKVEKGEMDAGEALSKLEE